MNYQVLLLLNTVLIAIYYIVNYTEVFNIDEMYYLRGNERNITLL